MKGLFVHQLNLQIIAEDSVTFREVAVALERQIAHLKEVSLIFDELSGKPTGLFLRGTRS